MAACLVMALILLVLSVFLFCGRGAWLSAGFNTLSEQEKARYDVPKLCRAVGALCLVCTLMLFTMAYLGYRLDSGRLEGSSMLVFSLVFVAVILGMVLFVGRYINKKAKK